MWGGCWGDWCSFIPQCTAARLTTDSLLTAWAGQTLSLLLLFRELPRRHLSQMGPTRRSSPDPQPHAAAQHSRARESDMNHVVAGVVRLRGHPVRPGCGEVPDERPQNKKARHTHSHSLAARAAARELRSAAVCAASALARADALVRYGTYDGVNRDRKPILAFGRQQAFGLSQRARAARG
jgi:hypothetical protein